MKKKFDLKKWIFNYLIFGVIPYFLLALFFDTLDSFTVRDIFYDLFLSLVVMIFFYPFKNLYYEYKEIWKTAKLDRKIFIILGIIFVVYGVYYRARLTWSFK